MIVHINPIDREDVPRDGSPFNPLMREMRAIAFVTSLIDEGACPAGLKRMLIHAIDGDDFMRGLGVPLVEPRFGAPTHLHDVGWSAPMPG